MHRWDRGPAHTSTSRTQPDETGRRILDHHTATIHDFLSQQLSLFAVNQIQIGWEDTAVLQNTNLLHGVISHETRMLRAKVELAWLRAACVL